MRKYPSPLGEIMEYVDETRSVCADGELMPDCDEVVFNEKFTKSYSRHQYLFSAFLIAVSSETFALDIYPNCAHYC